MRPAIQLYTLRTIGEPLTATLERLGDTVFEGVEFAGFGDCSPSTLATTLEETGLDAAGAHISIDTIEEEYEPTKADYGTLGCDRFVVPSYPSEAFETEAGVEEAATRFSRLAETLAADGIELHYHNHAFEFAPMGEGTAFDKFVEQTSDLVRFEVDIGLAQHAGADPIEVLERHADRISLVHLTDTRAGSTDTYHVDYGTGEVDLEACTRVATDIGAEWLLSEHGSTADPVATLERFDSTLRELL